MLSFLVILAALKTIFGQNLNSQIIALWKGAAISGIHIISLKTRPNIYLRVILFKFLSTSFIICLFCFFYFIILRVKIYKKSI